MRKARAAGAALILLGVPSYAWAQSTSGSTAGPGTPPTTLCYQALSDVILCSPNPPPPGARIVLPGGGSPTPAAGGGCLATNGSVCSGTGEAINGSDSSGCATAVNDSTASGGCQPGSATATTVVVDIVPRVTTPTTSPPTAQPAQPARASIALTG